MLKEFPTTGLVFWGALWQSGIIRDPFGHTELRPCNSQPCGNAPTLFVFPQRPMAPDQKYSNSVWLKTNPGSRKSLL
jgi:hypothetical protein